MNAAERREKVYQYITEQQGAVSATALSKVFHVTRQIIVGDIALLRAEGYNISATPRGYIIPGADNDLTFQIACCHNKEDTRKELYAMVDCGCTVLDVIVDHPIYGQLTAPLLIKSRYDADQFMQKMEETSAAPLSQLTEGVHLHTLQCPNKEVREHLISELKEMGVLYNN